MGKESSFATRLKGKAGAVLRSHYSTALLDRLPGDLGDSVAHRFLMTARDRGIIAGYDAEDGGRFSLDGQDRLGAVFIRVPKTGSMSICAALLGDRGGGHRTVRDYKRIYGPKEYRRRFSFAIVRDPYTRLVSAYTYLSRGGKTEYDRKFQEQHLEGIESFEQFVLEWLTPETILLGQHFRPQTSFVCDRGKVAVDFLGRFENLQEDFAHIARTLGVNDETSGEPIQLPHVNKTGRKRSAESFLTPEVCAKMAELYASDFEAFGYST